MRTCSRWFQAGVLACVLVLATGGCSTQTPEERIESLRSQYAAQVTGIVVKQDPVLPSGEAGENDSDDTKEAGEGDTEEADGTTATVPVAVEVVLDVLISTEAAEKLPGLTLDVSHGDSSGHEKEHRLVWVDTQRVERGSGTQVTVVLDNVAYQAGDGFHVEIRNQILAEERTKYREFSQ